MTAEKHRPQGYPSVDVLRNGQYKVEDAVEGVGYSSLAAFYTAAVPSLGSTFGDAPYTAATFETYTVGRRSDTDIWITNLTYKTSGYDSEKSSEGVPEEDTSGWTYRLENNGITMALATADGTKTPSSYLKSWDYDLVTNSTSETVPSWATSFGATSTIPSTSKNEYQWIKDEVELPVDNNDKGRWKIIQRRSKPGVSEYVTSAPQVIATRNWVSSDSGAQASWDSAVDSFADSVGTTSTPSETFGISAGEWLIVNVSSSNSGKYLSITVTYRWANVWDSDLYT